ncbi:hypothetical protein D9M68_210040 [compost metagenome]
MSVARETNHDPYCRSGPQGSYFSRRGSFPVAWTLSTRSVAMMSDTKRVCDHTDHLNTGCQPTQKLCEVGLVSHWMAGWSEYRSVGRRTGCSVRAPTRRDPMCCAPNLGRQLGDDKKEMAVALYAYAIGAPHVLKAAVIGELFRVRSPTAHGRSTIAR